MTYMTKIYTDTEQKIWVRISSSDLTLCYSVPLQTKSLLTFKRLVLSQQDSPDELFFSMVSDDGTIHIQNHILTSVNEPLVTDVLPTSSCFKRLAELFTGRRR